MKPEPAVLIYDAGCPFCRGTVEWVRRNAAAADVFEFLPCGSAEARRRFPSVGEADCMTAVHLVLPGGRVLAGGRALPEILRRIRGYRAFAPLLRLPGAGALSRLLYREFASRRHRDG